MSISLIVAYCQNSRGIGFQNRIPWYLPDDLKHFKETTLNSVVIMGKNTYLSIGKPLPSRINVVISSTLEPSEGIIVVRNMKECISLINNIQGNTFKNIYVIGGQSIYQEFFRMNLISSSIITCIHTEYPCDTFFPEEPPILQEECIRKTPEFTIIKRKYSA